MANARRRTQRPTTRSNTRFTVASSTGTASSDGERVSKAMDWEAQYKYVTSDLRQLLIVSIIIFALLFVVGFFI
jgi:hypothetical protein